MSRTVHLAALVCFVGAARLVAAEEIQIANADFEDPPLADGVRSDHVLPGWHAADFDGPFQFGAFNPDTQHFLNEAPHGIGVGYLRRGSIFQDLTDRFIPAAEYQISFYSGGSLLEPFGGLRVQLRVGQARVNMEGTAPAGQFIFDSIGIGLPPRPAGTPVELWVTKLDPDDASVSYFDDISIRTLPTARCPFDVTGNLEVNLNDLVVLLAHFGETAGAWQGTGDLDGDGDVDLADLTLLLMHFGTICG